MPTSRTTVAREARQASLQARDAYLAYRRDGGESHSPGARLSVEIARFRRRHRQRQRGACATGCHARPRAWLLSFVAALQAVVADEPGLDCDDAAEILLLLDRLTAAGRCALFLC